MLTRFYSTGSTLTGTSSTSRYVRTVLLVRGLRMLLSASVSMYSINTRYYTVHNFFFIGRSGESGAALFKVLLAVIFDVAFP